MCGRVQLDLEIGGPAMRRLTELLLQIDPGYSLTSGEKFPSEVLPVLRAEAGETKPRPALMQWGFKMSKAGQSDKLIINARAETAADKPMFRQALAQRRCVLATTGFYEWTHDAAKTKYLFRLPDRPMLYLAGLFSVNQERPSFVVLTQEANASMLEVHQRMPVILGQNELGAWLYDNDVATQLLRRTGPELTKQEA